MKLFRFKNFVRTCAFAIALLLSISSVKAAVVDITDQKREMRSAWIATVFNIDWPETKGNE